MTTTRRPSKGGGTIAKIKEFHYWGNFPNRDDKSSKPWSSQLGQSWRREGASRARRRTPRTYTERCSCGSRQFCAAPRGEVADAAVYVAVFYLSSNTKVAVVVVVVVVKGTYPLITKSSYLCLTAGLSVARDECRRTERGTRRVQATAMHVRECR